MRRSLRLASLVLLSSSAIGPAACVSDSNAPSGEDSGSPSLDAGTLPPFDAGPSGSDAAAAPDTSASPDATSHDGGATPEASTIDAADAALPQVSIAAASTSVTAEGTDALTVTLNGITAVSVEIDDGTTKIATLTASPYTTQASYTFLENGTHTYVAKVTLASSQVVTSAPLAVTVNVPANGFFVDPVNGVDTNAGTQAAPFKTVVKAAQSVTVDGQSVYLAPATYGAANQTNMHMILPHRTNIRGLADGVILNDITLSTGAMFTFSAGGETRNIAIGSVYAGIYVASGTFQSLRTTFNNVALPYNLYGTTVATIDETGVAQPVTNPIGGTSSNLLFDINGSANVTFLGAGGTLDAKGAIAVAVSVASTATLVASNFTFTNCGNHAVTVSGNANATLNNVFITSSGLGSSSGSDRGDIELYNNGTAPDNLSFTMNGGGISTSQGYGIVFNVYNTAGSPSINLNDTHVDTSLNDGIYIPTSTVPATGFSLNVNATNTTFDGNQGSGINVGLGNVTVNGGTISNNLTDGIMLAAAAQIMNLKVRTTTFDANTNDAISFLGAATSTLDLGTTASPGGLTFTKVAAAATAVHLQSVVAGQAVGNTWMPNVQGADATGKYTAATTLTSASSGLNAKLVTGATLVVE